jgi:hypothetical protein
MTHTTSGFELSVPLAYIETTIPPGMTLEEYRRSRPQRRRRRHWLRVGPRAERQCSSGTRANQEPRGRTRRIGRLVSRHVRCGASRA